MIKPIPKRLLPHNCVYSKYLGNNGEGDEWEDGIKLSHVKIEEKMQLKVTSNGREVVGNARLFYDTQNSSGLTEKPVQNSLITFNKHVYHIIDVAVLCGEKAIAHHYEVMLK